MSLKVNPDPFKVEMKLVADIHKKGEGAKVIPGGVTEVKPRVDIKTEVETGGARRVDHGRSAFVGTGGGTSGDDAKKIATQTGPVSVGAGKGVLGHLLANAKVLPDVEKLSLAELRALLAPHIGKPVVITTWDREEASTLAEAVKRQSVGDNIGVLVGVNDEGIVLKKDGRENAVNREFWAVARVKIDGGDVLAADPRYSEHFVA